MDVYTVMAMKQQSVGSIHVSPFAHSIPIPFFACDTLMMLEDGGKWQLSRIVWSELESSQ